MTNHIEMSATISLCGQYRYTLGRRWGDGSCVNFVMLNPSTADANVDDPTIRRCMGFAGRWGYGSLVVTNLFAWRATDPKVLVHNSTAVGPDNDEHLIAQTHASSLTVCAWGASGCLYGRSKIVSRMLSKIRPLHCLSLTKAGEPGHPLYLPGNLSPVPFGWSPVPLGDQQS